MALTKKDIETLTKSFMAIFPTRQEIDLRFKEIDQRFKEVDQRFNEIDLRFKEIEQRFSHVTTTLDHIVKLLETRRVEDAVAMSEDREQNRKLEEHERRIAVLELSRI